MLQANGNHRSHNIDTSPRYRDEEPSESALADLVSFIKTLAQWTLKATTRVRSSASNIEDDFHELVAKVTLPTTCGSGLRNANPIAAPIPHGNQIPFHDRPSQ